MKNRFFTYAILICSFIPSYSQTYDLQRETFYAASNYASNYLAVYDFNGDGLSDILVGGDNGVDLEKTPIYLLISQGDGTFMEETANYINGDLKAASPSAVNADYNQDGILDFAIFDKGHSERGQDPVYTGFYGEDAQLLLSNSNGTWDISTALADAHLAANEFGHSELHIKFGSTADVNQDGFPDIYVESGGGSQQLLSHIYYNNGDNTFSVGKLYEAIWEYPFKGESGNWRQQANSFADVNNDGYPDLLVGKLAARDQVEEGSKSYVMLNDGNGNFLEQGAIPLSNPTWHDGYTYVISILPIDLNDDGWMDFLYCQHRGSDYEETEDDAHTGYYIEAYINDKGVAFDDQTNNYINHTEEMLSSTHPVYGLNSNFGKAKLVDMNEDGFKDIFITDGPPVDAYNPLILFNDGSNFFNPAPKEVYNSITDGNEWTGESSYPIDLNGDDLLDIISSDLTGGPDGEYGTGDEYDEIYPVFGVRNYPKVTNISVSSDQEFVNGLDLTFIPDLGITHFYIEKIHGGLLYTSGQAIISDGDFIDKVTAESGFLFSPDLDFQGNAYFYIQGASAASTTNLVGSKFITKIEVVCGGPDAPLVSNDYIYCEGDEISPITIENIEGTIIWYADAQLSEVLAEGNTFTPSSIIGTTDYYVTIKLNVCESEASKVSVTVNENPDITINASSTSICIGESITLSGQGGVEYQWSNEIEDGVEFQPQKTTEYQLIGFDQNGCSNSATVLIEVNDLPEKPVITRTDEPSTFLISSASAGNQWFLNDEIIEGANDSEYKPRETGTYSVQVTINECSSEVSDDFEVLDIVLSLSDNNEVIKIWPNPANQTIYLDQHRAFSNYIIHNSSGQTIMSGTLNSDRINVSGFEKGVYFLQVYDKGKHVLKFKFVKE